MKKFNKSKNSNATEVCPNISKFNGQAKLERGSVIQESKLGKVTYVMSKSASTALTNKTYSNFFKFLESIEKELDENLSFYVSINYMTLEAFRYIETDSIDTLYENEPYSILKENVGKHIFALINDISLSKDTSKPRTLYDKYLYADELRKLNEFYANNNDMVMDCFSKNFSSLYLFDILYHPDRSDNFLTNITNIIKNKKACKRKRQLAYTLLLEYRNEYPTLISDRSKFDLVCKIYQIDKNMNKLNCTNIHQIKSYNIDNVYSLLEEIK